MSKVKWPWHTVEGSEGNPTYPRAPRNRYLAWYNNTYMHTHHWQRMRQYKLAESDGQCELCSSRDNLHLHHNSYRGCPYNEHPESLNILCETCHQEVTDNPEHPLHHKNAATAQSPEVSMIPKPEEINNSRDIAAFIKALAKQFDTTIEKATILSGCTMGYYWVAQNHKRPEAVRSRTLNNVRTRCAAYWNEAFAALALEEMSAEALTNWSNMRGDVSRESRPHYTAPPDPETIAEAEGHLHISLCRERDEGAEAADPSVGRWQTAQNWVRSLMRWAAAIAIGVLLGHTLR